MQKPSKFTLFWSLVGMLLGAWAIRKRAVSIIMTPLPRIRVALPLKSAVWPKEGSILSFGYRRTETHTHQGVDFLAPVGTPIQAMAPGIITHTVYETRRGFSGYGRVVVVEVEKTAITPKLWMLYGHLEEIAVVLGQRVSAGDLIGTVGRTCYTVEDPGRLCSSPHLHFEISPRPYPQDSEAWRYSPKQLYTALLTGEKPSTWVTT